MNLVLGDITLPFPESFRGSLIDLSAKATTAEGPAYLLEFNKFLRKEPTWASSNPPTIIGGKEVRIWATVEIGLHPSAMDLYWALKDIGLNLSPYATELFRKKISLDARRTIHLARVSLSQLGLEKGGTLPEVLDCITQKHPLDLLPPETGAYYRLQNSEEPFAWTYMAMQPIDDHKESLRYKSQRHDDYLWLPMYVGPGEFSAAGHYHPNTRWLVALREQK